MVCRWTPGSSIGFDRPRIVRGGVRDHPVRQRLRARTSPVATRHSHTLQNMLEANLLWWEPVRVATPILSIPQTLLADVPQQQEDIGPDGVDDINCGIAGVDQHHSASLP